jgi:hypothetical protein
MDQEWPRFTCVIRLVSNALFCAFCGQAGLLTVSKFSKNGLLGIVREAVREVVY